MDLNLEITAVNYLLSAHWGWAFLKKNHHIAPVFLRVSHISFGSFLSVFCTGFVNTTPWTQKMLLETVGREGISLS